MLELQNVSYRVSDTDGEREILHDVSLTIEERFVAITGPNGGGKSTLAKIIAGIYQPTEGRILLDGVDITNATITERAKLGISYAFQQPVRFKGLTVRDLICLAAGRELSMNEACAYLSEVGLCARDYINREVNASLSGGELKRIEIASIIARNTPLSVFDEPEAGIDLWSFARLTETFKSIHDKKEYTIIIISHQERIIRLADEIILLANGKLSDRGPADEIYPKLMGLTVANCNMLEVNQNC
jgi:Fe-S cluster assembly ATP-binding protein